jgi:23S rRNA (uracil1939-C5)-methyltransferase
MLGFDAGRGALERKHRVARCLGGIDPPRQTKRKGAEASRDAVLALKRAAPGIEAEHRDLYRRPLDQEELRRFGAVVLDPPRAGASEQVQALARSSVGRIAYVSCNPATFARDARTLVDGGYRLEWVKPVGQFRWSTHVELAAAFALINPGSRG